MILDHVFFATLVLNLECIQDENINPQTACTNGKVIRYFPGFIRSLTPKEVVCILAHEILHCVFGHHTRRGDRNLLVWNVACDLAINPLLREYGFQLPSGALLDESFKGYDCRTNL